MYKLLLKPDQNGYQIKEAKDVVSTELAGGKARYRRDLLNASVEVEVVFTCDPDEYAYLRAFYNTVNKGADAFNIDLLLDTPELRTYVAHFKPGTWKLSNVKGHSFQVKVTLEVIPNNSGLDYNNVVDTFVPADDYDPPPPPGNFGWSST